MGEFVSKKDFGLDSNNRGKAESKTSTITDPKALELTEVHETMLM